MCRRVFNKTIILLGLAGYEMIITNWALRASLVINCVSNKMLERDWLLTALIYALIGCFRSKLSDLTRPITNIWAASCEKGPDDMTRDFE